MPTAAPRVCARCGQAAAKGKACICRPPYEHSQHAAGNKRSARQRASKLRANPICETPGCRRPAVEVDHIIPLAEGGPRWIWTNLQSLCHPHHAEKTVIDARRGKTRPR